VVELVYASLILSEGRSVVSLNRDSVAAEIGLPVSSLVPVIRVLNEDLDFIAIADFAPELGLKENGVLYYQNQGRNVSVLNLPRHTQILAESPDGFVVERADEDWRTGRTEIGIWHPGSGVFQSLKTYPSRQEMVADALFGTARAVGKKGLKPYSPFHRIGLNGSWYSRNYGFLSTLHNGKGLLLGEQAIPLKPGTRVNFITGNSRWAGVSLAASSNQVPLNAFNSIGSRLIDLHQSDWMAVAIIDLQRGSTVRYLQNTYAVYFPNEYSFDELISRLNSSDPD